MLPWLYWLLAGALEAFWGPSLGGAVLGGRPCLCGEEYVMSDCWLGGALENLAAPLWCAEGREVGVKVRTNTRIKLFTWMTE